MANALFLRNTREQKALWTVLLKYSQLFLEKIEKHDSNSALI